jgi:L-amino acid N-acyltransferase
MQIRDASIADQAGILEIYNDAVMNTTAVWNEMPRTQEEQRQWFTSKSELAHPVVIAEMEGRVAGFASYGPFRPWYGYRFTVEGSIYVAPRHHRQGIGKRLLGVLIERARSQGLHVMIAGIEAQNLASIRLHEQAGYQLASRLHEVGFKFGRWLDLVLMELRLE